MNTELSKLDELRKNPIYLENFSCREDVFNNFAKSDDPDIDIVFASYDCPPYEGYATVIYYRKSTSKYYEIYGSHCSCYGLEGQWDREEEVLPEELFKRLNYSPYFSK